MSSKKFSSRRQFLATTGAAAAATAFLAPAIHAAGSDSIKVGLIGCGGRGSGAAENVLHAAKGVEIIALGDFYKDRADGLAGRLRDFAKDDTRCKELGNKADVADENCHGGLDAFKRIINTQGVNYIILATPPGFRPVHLQAAIAAGKNIFTEKPVGVDGPGIQKVLTAYEESIKKNLAIVAGTQRRHQTPYIETLKQIREGAIGDIVAARCFWNQNNIWFHPRKQGQTDLEYQIYNWYHFLWLCGDHIVEQHVHNLDVINWAMNAHPIRCLGMGGRSRPCKDPNVDGHIFNFFAVEYEYPNGVRMHSQCRQINNCDHNMPGLSGQSEALVGTKGTSQVNAYTINGKLAVAQEVIDRTVNPYVQEHTDLINSIRAGKPLNELKTVAESTLTAIMGRMSAYSGKVVTWQQALASKKDTMPAKLSNDMKLSVDPVPVPGVTKI